MHDNMMTLDQAQQWLAGSQRVGLGSVRFSRVHTDTRSLAPGDLFVALRGERFDANDFLAEAKAQGAVAAICQGDAQAQLQAAGLPGLVVADTKAALASLATQWRQQFKLPLVAVTGSNGKTTVTQMIAAILRAYKPQAYLATQGNLNNDIGVPLTLLRLRAHHEVAVLELGMNHPGEIAALAAMAQPTVALVNNAQREHLEFMATVQAVAEENGSVLDALPADGVAIFPADDAYSALWASKAQHCRALQFSTATISQDQDQDQDQAQPLALNTNQVYCEQATWSGDAWQVTAHTPAGRLSYALHIAGRHNVSNSLAAVASSCAAGVPLAAIAQGLSAFEPVKGRSRAVLVRHAGRLITLVDDTYNANPDSVRAALDVLADLPGPRLLVLGDMGEVGEQGPVFHAEAGSLARSLGIEQVFTLGVLSRATSQSFGDGQHFDTLDALQAAVLTALPHCASVLVKGARFMQMERVVQAISAPATSTLKETHAV
jgi:UDP-N-acetylmuramoyl-tripeptide--D-alanyl-D-alanine ligase